MPVVKFQQTINTVESLIEKWPLLEPVILSAEFVQTGLEVYSRDPRSREIKVTDAEANEAVAFYNKLITDGRFVKLAQQKPDEAAKNLGVAISPGAVKAVKTALAIHPVYSSGEADRPSTGTIVAVIICVVAFGRSKPSDIVVDSSGIVKI